VIIPRGYFQSQCLARLQEPNALPQAGPSRHHVQASPRPRAVRMPTSSAFGVHNPAVGITAGLLCFFRNTTDSFIPTYSKAPVSATQCNGSTVSIERVYYDAFMGSISLTLLQSPFFSLGFGSEGTGDSISPTALPLQRNSTPVRTGLTAACVSSSMPRNNDLVVLNRTRLLTVSFSTQAKEHEANR